MFANNPKKERAIALRKKGKSYSEILKEIPVAKSTLSEWLRDVGLSKKQVQRLTVKKLEAARRGGLVKHQQRILRTRQIHDKALKDIKNISKRELWLIGVALYWAEGSKEKDYYPGSRLQFGNSDPKMIKLFLKWLKDVCKISENDIGFEIYIHQNSINNTEVVRQYWSKVTGFSLDKINRVYYKRFKLKTNRRNTGNLYYGGIRVTVKASSGLLRKVTGWTEAIVQDLNCGIV
ncbi:MAG: hypothetical protein NTX96_03340 [Candidatus Zambryskibacteria bacterium]|nr:hypothetical protein [Candidatus Zambryskibacteria bacterium]